MRNLFNKYDFYGFYLAVIFIVGMSVSHTVLSAVKQYLTAQEVAERKYENR